MATICIQKGYKKPMILLYAFLMANENIDSERIFKIYIQPNNFQMYQICCEIFNIHRNVKMLEHLVTSSKSKNLPVKLKENLYIALIKAYLKNDMRDEAVNMVKTAIKIVNVNKLLRSVNGHFLDEKLFIQSNHKNEITKY